MDTWRLRLGDCVELLKELSENSVDSIVTDPPAGISFMNKTWDKPGVLGVSGGVAMPSTTSSRNPSCKVCGGRKRAGPATKGCTCETPEWNDVEYRLRDRGAFIAFMTTVMRECLRVLRPGGHALVWALPRTSHWTAMGIEDAGFEIRDDVAVLLHCFGTGFPKSLSVSKAIDKAAGAEREVIGVKSYPREGTTPVTKLGSFHEVYSEMAGGGQGSNLETSPATDAAKQWEGWGTALKPAVEFWIVARKPLSEPTVAANVIKHGCGALNIDGCRVGLAGVEEHRTAGSGALGTDAEVYGKANDPLNSKQVARAAAGLNPRYDPSGRWPPNLVISHLPECEQVGTRKVKGITGGDSPVRRSGVHAEAGGHQTVGRQQTHSSHADPDGTETVEAWVCVTAGSDVVASFSGSVGGGCLVDEPASLLDLAVSVLREVRGCSTVCSDLLLGVSEAYGSPSNGSGAASVVDAAARALGLSGLPDFRFGCPSCRDSCGERVRQVVDAARDGVQQLVVVLESALQWAASLGCSPHHPSPAHLSSSGVARVDDTSTNRGPSRTSPARRREVSPEMAESSGGRDESAPPLTDRCGSSGRSNRASSDGNSETDDHSACSDAAVRLLVGVACDLACTVLPSVVLRRDDVTLSWPSCPVAELDRQSAARGMHSSGSVQGPQTKWPKNLDETPVYGGGQVKAQGARVGDVELGNQASRFFPTFENEPPFKYQAKAARKERWLYCESCGVVSKDWKAHKKDDGHKPVGHPTQKPVALMRWLCRLVTPPINSEGVPGLILDPFAGSGSTGVAAVQEGFRFLGFDKEEQYCEIAAARLQEVCPKIIRRGM